MIIIHTKRGRCGQPPNDPNNAGWPSKTGNPSGGKRGNGNPKK